MKTLTAITARDLMKTDVIKLGADERVETAVALFEEYHVGGAPVVDSAGTLLGFLSAHDVARSEHVERGRIVPERGDYGIGGDEADDGETYFSKADYSPEVLEGGMVKDWMNPAVISLPPSASLKELCQVMVSESIHRVLIVESKSLRGIVSTFDVVRHLAEVL
jgi:CBS domain-containing protein